MTKAELLRLKIENALLEAQLIALEAQIGKRDQLEANFLRLKIADDLFRYIAASEPISESEVL